MTHLGAWLLAQAPAHLPALREVPHLESRRGGCRRERGIGHQEEHPEWGKGSLGSAPGPSLTLGCCEQSPFLKQASPCRCVCSSLIFKLEKQLKEFREYAAPSGSGSLKELVGREGGTGR